MSNPQPNVVLGLGNTMHGDDGIGIYVIERLQADILPFADVYVTEEMGLSLLDFLSGYERAVIVDSVKTEKGYEGQVHRFSLRDFAALPYCGCHQVGLPEMALLAKEMGIPFPQTVHILGIEIEDPYRVANTLSPSLRRKLPDLVHQVRWHILKLLQS
ncbi:MAG: hydrogenase maturation protease [Calditrichaeota bacterium]|nr:hydrogenase maturation protease [Calditrichota bacterium]